MGSLFTNLVQKVVISRKWTENGPMLDREWTDEVAEKSVRKSTVWAMMWVKLVNFAKLVMQFLKWTKWTKWTEQILDESAESAKSAKSIFATFATFASANFVGKASCESTVRYREWSRIPSCCLRSASVIALICFLGIGNAWGTVYTYDFTEAGTAYWTTDNSTTAITTESNVASFYYMQSGYSGHRFTNGSGDNYKFHQATGYECFFLGKLDATITLPSYSDPVTKVTVTRISASYGSADATINIYSGTNAASTGSTVSTSGTDFSIDSKYQKSALKIVVTNDKNIGIVSISVTTEDSPTASITVTDDEDNELDAIAFGSVTEDYGEITVNVATECIANLISYGGYHYLQAAITGTDDENFAVNDESSVYIDDTSGSITIAYIATASGTYEANLNIWGYKDDDCKEYTGDYIDIDIPLSVTYTLQHTVTWHINGATSTTKVADNTKPTPPSVDVADYCGDVFVGWTKCNITGSVGSESSVSGGGCGLYKSAGTLPNITADAEFYAVFADEQP